MLKSAMISIIILVILTGLGASFPTPAYPAKFPWPESEGWSARYILGDDELACQVELVQVEQLSNGQRYEFMWTLWDDRVSRYNEIFLQDEAGDLYFEMRIAPETGESYYFDPPLLYLDFPLTEGKSWTSISTRYSFDDTTDAGIKEHHQFRVESKEIETPAGTFDTFHIIDEPLAGASIRGNYLQPGFGPVAFDFPDPNSQLLMNGNSAMGWDSKLGLGQEITFNFDWSMGINRPVHKLVKKIKTRGTNADTTSAYVYYNMLARQQDDAILVSSTNFQIVHTSEDGHSTSQDNVLQNRINNLTPDYFVTTRGEFKSLDNKEAFHDSVMAYMEPLWQTDDPQEKHRLESLSEKFNQMFNPELLEAMASNEWNTLIGAWQDAIMEIGTVMEASYQIPHPVIPKLLLDITSLYLVSERCPCNKSDTENNCVLAIVTSYSAPDTDGSELITWLQELDPTLSIPEAIPQLTLITSARLIINPNGMLPYSLKTSELTRLSDIPNEPDYESIKYKFLLLEDK